MNTIPDIMSMINWYYCLVSVLVVYFILKYLFKKTKSWFKALIHVIIGIVLGILWKYVLTPTITLESLVLSFLITLAFYQWILKQVMKKFEVEYDNGKGVI